MMMMTMMMMEKERPERPAITWLGRIELLEIRLEQHYHAKWKLTEKSIHFKFVTLLVALDPISIWHGTSQRHQMIQAPRSWPWEWIPLWVSNILKTLETSSLHIYILSDLVNGISRLFVRSVSIDIHGERSMNQWIFSSSIYRSIPASVRRHHLHANLRRLAPYVHTSVPALPHPDFKERLSYRNSHTLVIHYYSEDMIKLFSVKVWTRTATVFQSFQT